MWSSGMASQGMKIWTGSCGSAGRKKMKVRVLEFLGIRSILGFLKNNKDSLVFVYHCRGAERKT